MSQRGHSPLHFDGTHLYGSPFLGWAKIGSLQRTSVPSGVGQYELPLIDHECGHLLEELPKKLFDFGRQRGFGKCFVHQPHPAVSRGLIDVERNMPRPQARMSALFNIFLRTSKPVDQEIAQTLFCARTIFRGIHASEYVVVRHLAIKRSDEAREAFLSNTRVNVSFIHDDSVPV